MSKTSSELIRPSSLPKLEACRAYVGTAGTSEAAERGTKLDGVIRRAWSKWQERCNKSNTYPHLEPADIDEYAVLEPKDRKAVEWALNTMRELAGFGDIVTEEEQLQAVVPVPGIKPGTMDALCCTECSLIDFKTGQERDYRAQMAAYALACMDMFFTDTWTAYLLFIDQELVVKHEFTEEEARALVERIVNAPVEPTACEYCSWCGSFGTCPLTRRQVADVVEVANTLPRLTPHAKSTKELPPSLEDIAADDRLSWEFLAKFATVSSWVDLLKEKIRERMESSAARGEKNAYFSLQRRRGKRVFPARAFDHVIGEIGNMGVLSICGPASVEDARALWEKRVQRIPFPEDLVIEQGACMVLQRKSAKAIPQLINTQS